MKFELEKLLTVKDTEKAKELIGKKVIFGDSVYDIEIKKKVSTLRDINFLNWCESIFGDDDDFWYNYIYPYEDEEPKKKLVPFTWEDRDILRGKWVKEKDFRMEECIDGFDYDDEFMVYVSGASITMNELFRRYTFLDGSPIGKEVEE